MGLLFTIPLSLVVLVSEVLLLLRLLLLLVMLQMDSATGACCSMKGGLGASRLVVPTGYNNYKLKQDQ